MASFPNPPRNAAKGGYYSSRTWRGTLKVFALQSDRVERVHAHSTSSTIQEGIADEPGAL